MLIEQAERLGEPPEDPLLLFDVLYGFWYANLGAKFNGGCAGATSPLSILALAEKQRAMAFRSWLPAIASWGSSYAAREISWTTGARELRSRRSRFTILPSKHRSLGDLGSVKTY